MFSFLGGGKRGEEGEEGGRGGKRGKRGKRGKKGRGRGTRDIPVLNHFVSILTLSGI